MEKKHTFPLSLGQWKGGNIGCWTRRFVPLKYPCLHKHPPIHWPENTQILSKSSEKMQLAIVDLMGDATLVDLLGPFFTLPLPSIASEDLWSCRYQKKSGSMYPNFYPFFPPRVGPNIWQGTDPQAYQAGKKRKIIVQSRVKEFSFAHLIVLVNSWDAEKGNDFIFPPIKYECNFTCIGIYMIHIYIYMYIYIYIFMYLFIFSNHPTGLDVYSPEN